ncbi:MAG: hypothetical protein LJE97_05495 [Betaproteobacteria bacterium]|jgi:hypothetical protein|nr:hypothetical protein [Betaproteobacteria bacterium]
MRRVVASTLAMVAAGAAIAAGPIRLDDSLSPLREVRAQLVNPRFSSPSIREFAARAPGVQVNLNVAAYVGQRARIYITLPPISRGEPTLANARLQWRGRQVGTTGEILVGARQIVFEGVIDEPVFREVFDFTVYYDPSLVTRPVPVEPVFEIELP